MAYKTILVHLNRACRCAAILQPALQLARRHTAHVIGLYVQTDVRTFYPVDGMGSIRVLEADLAAEQKNAETVAATFAKTTADQPFTAEFRSIPATMRDHAANALVHATTVDLIVASQNDPDWDRSPHLDFPERLILESGRPVLVVPYVGTYPVIGQTVVVAWKPGREAARAVFNAIPIMKTAKLVHILQIAEGNQPVEPDTELAATLARHGIKANISTSQAVGQSVGSELLSRLFDLNADLLVMGAYGHARLREYVFGGATRDLTQQMTVPTLFSH